jgi:hypothetical protein
MIKVKITKTKDNTIRRKVNGEEYKFTPVDITTRNNTLNKIIEKGSLYGIVLYNQEPIHNFRAGDLVKINRTLLSRSKYIDAEGVDCYMPDWVGLIQSMFKTDLQLLKLEAIDKSSTEENEGS